jgi:hypothetical protein
MNFSKLITKILSNPFEIKLTLYVSAKKIISLECFQYYQTYNLYHLNFEK